MRSKARFRYALDPLCLAACALYAANRWMVKPFAASSFFHGQFNDMLLIPAALPFILWLQRRCGLRNHDAPPTVGEVTSHLVVWALLVEFIGPRWLHHGIGDPLDCLAYSLGALVACTMWRLPVFLAGCRSVAK